MQKHIRENGNVIYGDLSKQVNLKLDFKGKNNIVFFAGGSRNISMVIHGNNGLIFIGQNVAKIDISMVGESVLFIGDNSSFWGTTFRVLESKYIFLGNDCMFSWKINLETSDHHTICDILTNNRINFSKSIYIGDHVWCAQGVMIAKGAFIASGTMLGANSLAVSKEYYSNTVYAGSPAREIKKDIFWSRKYPGNYTKEQTQLNINIQGDDFKYTYNQNEFLSPKAIEEKLDSLNTAQEKLEFVYNAIYCNKNKNRFAYFKDMPYDIPLPKYESKFKYLKFEEIDETKPQPTPPAPKPTPQPTTQELEIKSLKDKLSQKEKDINNLDINHKKALTSQELEIKALKEQLAQKEQELINMRDKFGKQNTNISILENNYQKALNTKNHLSYKLGAALIKADKNWYKGGYIKFIFEVIRINKEHKNNSYT